MFPPFLFFLLPSVVQQQPTFNVNPAMFQQQQPLAFNPYQQQFGLGAIGQAQQPIYQQPIYPTIGANQPLAWGGAANVQQPITLGGYGAIPAGAATAMPLGYGASTTIPAVLPQNFGNPSAAYGTLGAPVLSPQQVEKLKRTSVTRARVV